MAAPALPIVAPTQWTTLISAFDLACVAGTCYGPARILDLNRTVIWCAPDHSDICATIGARLGGGPACHGCLKKPSFSANGFRIVSCDFHVVRAEAEFRVAGKVAGFITSPDWPQKGCDPLRTGMKRKRRNYQRIASPSDWEPELTRVARALEDKLELTRAERILSTATMDVRNAGATDDVNHAVANGLLELFGEVEVALYVGDASGFTHRKSTGVVPRFQRDLSPQIQKGLSRASIQGQTLYENSKADGYSLLFLPIPKRNDDSFMSVSVVIKAHRSNAFHPAARIAAQSIVSSGHAKIELLLRSRNKLAPVVFSDLTALLAKWRAEVIEILNDAVGNRTHALACRRKLYRAMTEEVLRISGATRTSIRLANPANQLRFAACAGKGWDEAQKQMTYTNEWPSTPHYALKEGIDCYIEDTNNPEFPYYPTFPDTRSIFVMPFVKRDGVSGVITASWTDPNGLIPEVRESLMSLRSEFESVLDTVGTVEHGLVRTLERNLWLRRDLRAFCRDATQLVASLFQPAACSVFVRPPEASVLELEGHTSDLGYQGISSFLSEELPRIAQSVVTTGNPDKGNVMSSSWLALPLISPAGTRGALCLVTPHPMSDFSAEDETFLAQIAGWLAEMVNTFISGVEVELRVKKLADQTAHAQKVVRADGLDRVALMMAERILIDERAISVHFRLADSGGHLNLIGAAGFLSRVRKPSAADGGISRIAWKQRDAQWAEDVGTSDPWGTSAKWMRDELKIEPTAWIKSTCALPLIMEEKCFGVLVINWKDTQRFDPHRKEQLVRVAGDCAVLLDRRLQEDATIARLERQLETLTGLRETSAEFARTRDLGALLDRILAIAKEKTRMEVGTIRLFNEEKKRWVLRAPVKPLRGQVKEIEPGELIDRAIKRESPLHITDLASDDIWKSALSKIQDKDQFEYLARMKSLLQIPIRLGESIIGLLTLHSDVAIRTPDSDSESLLAILASYVAVAVEIDSIKAQVESMTHLVEVSEFSADFLHVISNHVNAIQAILSTIKGPEDADPDSVDRMNRLRKRTAGLLEACETVQTSVASANQEAREKVNLNTCLQTVITDFEDVFRGVRRELAPALDDTFAFVSQRQIESAIRHVVRNALEAMTQKGTTLTLRTGRRLENSKRVVFVEIVDDGPGMDAEAVEKCFQPFFTRKQGKGGSGLGLWSARERVRRNGGDITISSVLGAGTSCLMEFPERI